jgi:hypothetical protein
MRTANQTRMQRLIEEVKSECAGDETKINEIIRSAVSSSAEKQREYLAFARDMELIASRAIGLCFANNKKNITAEQKKEFRDFVNECLERNQNTHLNWSGILKFIK